jgi:hypothetical protein
MNALAAAQYYLDRAAYSQGVERDYYSQKAEEFIVKLTAKELARLEIKEVE